MLKASASLATLSLCAALALPTAAHAGQRPSSDAAPTARPASAAPTPRTAPRPAAGAWIEQDYRLGPGDKLRVEVYEQDQLSQSVQIRPDGKITLPFIGEVVASGQTALQLRDSLTTSFKQFVVNPVVTVIVQEATSAQVCVTGEVRTPGCQVMNGPMTMLEAIARAGDVTEFANRSKMRILRRNGARQDTIAFNYKAALNGEIGPVFLQPGDVIVVP